MGQQDFSDETILDRLDRHARSMPDRSAYKFLRDGREADARTFGQLAERVRAVASHVARHARPGDRALLLYPPGLEFVDAFLGCLAAGVVAVPAYPPRDDRKAERLQAIAEDARPFLILTTRQALSAVEGSELGRVNGLLSLATDDVEVETGGGRPLPDITGDTVALFQYTSGSTGTPRGVMVTHGNLMANEEAIAAAFAHSEESVVVGWLPAFHDMGLVGNILQPLYVGCLSVLFAPAEFLREPVRWLRAITEYRGTSSGAPNFAYDLCARQVTAEQTRGLDLSSWRVAFNGAEPVRAETLDRFAEAFGDCGFRRAAFFPCYGLAEATLFVSGGPAGEGPRWRRVESAALEAGRVAAADPPGGRWLVGSGRPAEGTKVVAVEPATRMPVPHGRVGELWVSSPGVAGGYWGRPEETRDAVANYLASGEGPFLSTGDLGFIDGGEVFVTGRRKDLIIIRGRNLYPQDVEAAVAARLAASVCLNGCAAFSLEGEGGERLCLVVEGSRALVLKASRSDPEVEEVLAAIRAAVVREFDVAVSEVAVVRPGTFPRTTSGKVRRQACRAALAAGTLDAIAHYRVAALAVNELDR